MHRLQRLSSWLALFLIAPSLVAQTYVFEDSAGERRTTRNFSEIPASAYPRMRCRVAVEEVLGGDRLRVAGGHTVRLIGVDAPDPESTADLTSATRARDRLRKLVTGRTLTLRFGVNFKDERFDTLAYASIEDTLLNRVLIEEGLARAVVKRPNVAFADEFRSAQAAARRARRGLWAAPARETPRDLERRRRAFSLGLYSRDDAFDYQPFLRELVDLGVTDVMLITPWFLENHLSQVIERRPHRTCSMATVDRVIRQARELGLQVALMPIVLLENPQSDKWRGNIEPPDVNDWFSGYLEFILPFADVARQAGAEMLMVGSEFSSLEKHVAHWRNVIANVRSRYDGLLSYSANWDHLEVIEFWNDLDLISMTGYHSLTKRNDPTVEELTARWVEIREQLLGFLGRQAKPYVFSELGYASLDGINKNPWDYVSPKTVDDQEQADCYEAFLRAWDPLGGGYRGAYFYTWWRNDDAADARQYTVQGKPAEKVIRRHFRGP